MNEVLDKTEYNTRTFRSSNLLIDKCIFWNCTFKNCIIRTIEYSHFEQCEFINCSITLSKYNSFTLCTGLHFINCIRYTSITISSFEIKDALISNSVIKGTGKITNCNIFNPILVAMNDDNIQCTSCKFLEDSDIHKNVIITESYKDFPLSCPSEGSFIGWKKITSTKHVTYIVKLEIPEDAKRVSALSHKCRCDKAKVLSIKNIFNNSNVESILHEPWTSLVRQSILYKVGEMVYPDGFTEDRYQECSHGIHFFIDQESAIHY